MTTNPEQFLLDAWKQQSDTWLRIIDAMTKGAEKVRATQLAVASDTNAAVLRVKQSIADVENLTELWNAEMTWAIANLEKSAGYWQSLFAAANETNVKICSCLSEQAQAFGAQEGTAGPALSAINASYGEMFRNSQRMFAMTTEALAAASKPDTAAAMRPARRDKAVIESKKSPAV